MHAKLRDGHRGLLTVIAPRHPERGPAIAQELVAAGLTVARRAANEAIGPATDVYVADTIGELGLFFRLAGVAFVGKSLVPLGGQNPLEAAALDCAILFGPHMGNFRDIAARLTACGAAEEVADEAGLAEALCRLLADPVQRRSRAEAGHAFAKAESRVLERIAGDLAPFLTDLPESEADHARP